MKATAICTGGKTRGCGENNCWIIRSGSCAADRKSSTHPSNLVGGRNYAPAREYGKKHKHGNTFAVVAVGVAVKVEKHRTTAWIQAKPTARVFQNRAVELRTRGKPPTNPVCMPVFLHDLHRQSKSPCGNAGRMRAKRVCEQPRRAFAQRSFSSVRARSTTSTVRPKSEENRIAAPAKRCPAACLPFADSFRRIGRAARR